MHQHELAAQPPGGERACLDGAAPRVGAAAGQQRDVALAEAEPAPFGVLGVGEVDDVVMAALDPVEPAGVARCAGDGTVLVPRPRSRAAGLPWPYEQDRGALAGELLRQRRGDRFRVGRVAPRRDDGDGAVPPCGCGRSTASSRSMSSRAIWARKPGFCSISALNDAVRSRNRSLSRTARTVADRIRSLSSAISPMTAPRPRSSPDHCSGEGGLTYWSLIQQSYLDW